MRDFFHLIVIEKPHVAFEIQYDVILTQGDHATCLPKYTVMEFLGSRDWRSSKTDHPHLPPHRRSYAQPKC